MSNGFVDGQMDGSSEEPRRGGRSLIESYAWVELRIGSYTIHATSEFGGTRCRRRAGSGKESDVYRKSERAE